MKAVVALEAVTISDNDKRLGELPNPGCNPQERAVERNNP